VNALVTLPRATPGTPVQAEEVQRLAGVLERAGFVGNRVVLAVPALDQMTAMLELPPRAPGIPFEQIAKMEFARVNRCEPAGLELSFWELPDSARAGKGTHAMAVGCTHAAGERFLDLVEKAGIDAHAMDVMACAVARPCIGLAAASTGTTAVLDLGYTNASLSMLQAGTLVYERRMPEGGMKHLAESMKKQLDVGDEEIDCLVRDGGFGEPGDRRGAEAFADARRVLAAHFAPVAQELRTTFGYLEYQYPQSPVKQMLLVGGGATIPGLAAHLQSTVGIEVRAVQPRDVVDCLPSVAERATPAMMTAIGLAMFEEA
jgi:Tfp pilus assembly PilM family ATPase